MQQFWLIALFDSTVALHLVGVDPTTKQVKVLATGLTQVWSGELDKLVQAVNISMDGCSQLLGVPLGPDAKKAAFIVSPYWVGADGKVLPDKKQIIEQICKSLDLQPMGFTSYDDALAEYFANQNKEPISTVLVHIFQSSLIVSLVISSKIRQRQNFLFEDSSQFSPKLVEDALFGLKAAGVLPPEIIVFGDSLDQARTDLLSKYPWQARPGRELFSQPPVLKKYISSQIAQIYAEFIVGHLYSAFTQTVPQPQFPPSISTPPSYSEDQSATETQPDDQIMEVDPVTFGFGQSSTTIVPEYSPSPRFSFRIPRLRFPQNLSFPFLSSFKLFIPLFLIAAIFSGLVFTSKVDITLFATPLSINKSQKVTLDTQTKSFDPIKNTIPALVKNTQIEVKSSLPATGKKVTGEKSKGEVIIYNKSEKSLTILKNTVLKDATGRRFVLLNNTTVSGSQANLEAGVISLGQTKVIAQAELIGADGNIAKDTPLSFDPSVGSGFLLAKVSQPFTGGASKDIVVVSREDKLKLEKDLAQKIKDQLDQKVNEEKGSPDILSSTLRIVKGKTEYNREIDEEASLLEGTLNATVTALSLSQKIKEELISTYIRGAPDYSATTIQAQDIKISFTSTSLDDKQAVGTIIFTGSAMPELNQSELKKDLVFVSYSDISAILQKNSSRIFDYKITNDSPILKLIKRLPVQVNNINLIPSI